MLRPLFAFWRAISSTKLAWAAVRMYAERACEVGQVGIAERISDLGNALAAAQQTLARQLMMGVGGKIAIGSALAL